MTRLKDDAPQVGPACGDDPPLFAEDGTDLTVIRWMLAMSVEERLAWLQAHLQSVAAMRRARRSPSAPQPHQAALHPTAPRIAV